MDQQLTARVQRVSVLGDIGYGRIQERKVMQEH